MTGRRIGPRIGENIPRPSAWTPEPVPTPEYTSMDTEPWWQWWTLGMRTLIKHAERHGWQARAGFSRCGEQDTVGIWVDGYGRRAVAFWDRRPEARFTQARLDAGVELGEVPSGAQWSASGVLLFGIGSIPGDPRAAWPYANLTEFKVWLAARGEMPLDWYATSRDRVMAAREAARIKAKAAPDVEVGC